MLHLMVIRHLYAAPNQQVAIHKGLSPVEIALLFSGIKDGLFA